MVNKFLITLYFLSIAALNSIIFSLEGISINTWWFHFNTWIMICQPKCKYMLKLVIFIPKINHRFIIKPIVLVQARKNATQPSVQTCLLDPLVVTREMTEPSGVLNGVYLSKICTNTWRIVLNPSCQSQAKWWMLYHFLSHISGTMETGGSSKGHIME